MAPVCSSASPVTGCPGRTYTEEAAGVGTRRRPGGGLGSCNPGGLSPSLWASFWAGTGRDQPGSRAAGGPRRPRPAALSSTATRQRARAARFSLGPGRGSVRVAPWGLSPAEAPGSAAHPWGQRHPPRPPTGAEGLAEYGGGVTPGASVPSGCPKAPQSWRPETPGGGVSRGGPFWTSLEASVPGPSPGPGDSRQPLAPLASASLPHGAQSLPSPGVSLHVALRSPQRPHPNMTDHTCDSPVSRRGPLLSPERTWILGMAWPGQVVATSEAAACALEQAVTADPPAPSALNFRVGEEHRPGGAGPTCGPRKRTPGVPEFSAFSTRSAPRARAQPRHCLCDAETGPPSPPQPPPAGLCCWRVTGRPSPPSRGHLSPALRPCRPGALCTPHVAEAAGTTGDPPSSGAVEGGLCPSTFPWGWDSMGTGES